jgi:multicomponent Na+:H+ antiporter subunit F
VIDLALILTSLGFVAGLIRVVAGPSLADRIVAADVCFFAVIGSFGLLAVKVDVGEFVDAVLVATLLGFLATVALASLMERR